MREAKLEKAAKGLYVSPNAESDPLFELQYRYPKAIFSHETALFLLGEGERAPLTPTITLPQSSGTARLKNEDITVRKVADNRFAIGLASAITMFGHTVRVYDLERTICDLFRSRSTVDPQDLQSAFQNYMRSAHIDLVKLMNYAHEFRLVNVMRPYLEAVMPA
ncbi:Abortive infection protein AbiEi [Bifidobacterium breve S27]|nr:Abortive infection protein AbiEi [Bifidobacterium breve S27]